MWVPSKDTGVDLLVTDARHRKAVSLQVKFSKDFNPSHGSLLQSRLLAAGWWKHDVAKIKKSAAEHRFITVGMSRTGRILMVSHTDRGDKVRIISARKTTPQERRQYEEGQ